MNITHRAAALLAIAALGLGACVPTNTDPNANRTRDGAIVGGMLGGFLGAVSNDDNRGRNAVLGAQRAQPWVALSAMCWTVRPQICAARSAMTRSRSTIRARS